MPKKGYKRVFKVNFGDMPDELAVLRGRYAETDTDLEPEEWTSQYLEGLVKRDLSEDVERLRQSRLEEKRAKEKEKLERFDKQTLREYLEQLQEEEEDETKG